MTFQELGKLGEGTDEKVSEEKKLVMKISNSVSRNFCFVSFVSWQCLFLYLTVETS